MPRGKLYGNGRFIKKSKKANLGTQEFFNRKLKDNENFLQETPETEIKTSHCLKYSDPRIILLLSLMLIATTYGIHNHMNQEDVGKLNPGNNKDTNLGKLSNTLVNNKPNNVDKQLFNNPVNSDNNKLTNVDKLFTLVNLDNNKNNNIGKLNSNNNKPNNCKNFIVYETHDDRSPTELVNKMLPLLKDDGFTTYLFEEPKDMSLDINIESLGSNIEKISNHPTLKYLLQTKNFIDSWNATANLLHKIKEQGLTYVAVDMDKSSRAKLPKDSEDPYNIKVRDSFMANSIDEACKQHGANQVFIVGSMHGKIAHLLKEKGHEVFSVFVIDHAPIRGSSLEERTDNYIHLRADNDIMLRNSDVAYLEKYGYGDMHVVDLHSGDFNGAAVNLTALIGELELI